MRSLRDTIYRIYLLTTRDLLPLGQLPTRSTGKILIGIQQAQDTSTTITQLGMYIHRC